MRKLRENPISGYQLPADGQSENYCYTPVEVEGIWQHAGPFFGDVFRFLALTGLRQGELMWLTKADLDVAHRLVRIRAKAFPKRDCSGTRKAMTVTSRSRPRPWPSPSG